MLLDSDIPKYINIRVNIMEVSVVTGLRYGWFSEKVYHGGGGGVTVFETVLLICCQ